MKIIEQNPFRVLALPVTASEKDIAKRINELSTFAEFGKTKDYHTDFGFISPLNRSVEDIEEAARAIELPEKKLYHSLFWFWNHNSIDDLVFDVLKDGDTQKAITLWRKTVTDAVNAKNYSNAHNLSLLYLILSIRRTSINPVMFFAGLDISCKILSHEELGTYSENFSIGTNFSGIQHKVQKFYIDQIVRISAIILGKGNGIEAKKIINSFQSLPTDSYQYASGKFLNKPIYEIETAVDVATKKRKAEPKQSYMAGINLVKNTKDNLSFLGEVLSQDDIQYQLITDKIINELLGCSTDFFNEQIKVDKTLLPYEKAKELSQYALRIAVGSRAKNKITEDLSLIDRLIEDKKAGDKKAEKEAELDKHFSEIYSRIEKIPDPESISPQDFKNLPDEARKLVNNCKVHLDFIKKILGKDNEYYLGVCNSIVNNAMGMCIDYANKLNEYEKPMQVLDALAALDMSPEVRGRLLKNKSIINNNLSQAKEESQIKSHIDNITKRIGKLPNLENFSINQIENLSSLIDDFILQCKKDLAAIKIEVGSSHDAFIGLSNSVAEISVFFTIKYVNTTSDYSGALKILESLDPFSLVLKTDLVNRIKENKDILTQNSITKALSSYKKKQGICYVATMVYGDYNAPEVKILRQYRDNVLAKHFTGQLFIKVYYRTSPLFVRIFRNNKLVKHGIRRILSKIIEGLTK